MTGPRAIERVWYSLKEATERTGLSERSLKQAIYDGHLRTSQAGPHGKHRIHRDWLDEFLASRSKPARRPRRAAS